MKWMVQQLAWSSVAIAFFAIFSAPSLSAQYTWSNIGPTGGFVSSVAFEPSWPGVIWASGDDSDGLYVSNDSGAHWALVAGPLFPTMPPDQSTFALTIDPATHYIYAPNHYGRGMLKSYDGGNTWSQTQAGLPSTSPYKHL